MTDEKKVAKVTTDQLKETLQVAIGETLGTKISKQKAWEVFKMIHHAVPTLLVENIGENEEAILSLAGVGKYKLVKTEPRGKKAGLDQDGNPVEGAYIYPFVPRYKFYPSSATMDTIEIKMGVADSDKVKEVEESVAEQEDKKPMFFEPAPAIDEI